MSWKGRLNSTTSFDDVKRCNGEAMAEVRAVVGEYQETHRGVSGAAEPTGGCVDLEYIRNKVSVLEIAMELGLEVKGNTARCWRIENHVHGDRDPSIRFHHKRNRWRCFVCDEKGAASTFDLVMGVLGCDFRSAVNWIVERWPVPSAPRGRHVKKRQGWNPAYRAGASGDPLELVIRSGLWAQLTKAQQAILPVLLRFVDPETGLAQISYRGIMRYANVRSSATVAAAIRRFCRSFHMLEIERRLDAEGFRSCNRYRFTFEDPAFLILLREIYLKHGEEIRLERTFRNEERKRRRKQSKNQPVEAPVTCKGSTFVQSVKHGKI